MVAPSWSIAYLGYLALIVTVQVAVCEQDHPDTSGNIFESVMGLATGTYCEELWPEVQFVLFLTITLPGVLLLYSLITPLFGISLGGAAAALVMLAFLGVFFAGLV